MRAASGERATVLLGDGALAIIFCLKCAQPNRSRRVWRFSGKQSANPSKIRFNPPV
jgi:hypothetical protein